MLSQTQYRYALWCQAGGAGIGRKTHRTYRTPVNVFPRAGGFVIALTYGPESQWVRNVLANGGCRLESRGHTWRFVRPDFIHDEKRQAVPPPLRLILELIGVADFLDLTIEDDREIRGRGAL